MGRIILPALVAFLLGIGGTSAMAVVRAKHTAATTTVVHADSSHADSVHAVAKVDPLEDSLARVAIAKLNGDTAAPHAAPGVDVHAAPARRPNASGVPAVPSPLDSARAKSPATASPSARTAVASNATSAAGAPSPQEHRLAKIFGMMAPKDAARVLLQMSDDDVQTILGYLAEKQAAAILVNFPPQRAAVLGRSVMRGAVSPVAVRTAAEGAGR